MAKRKKRAVDPGKQLQLIPIEALTPETRLAIGMGQLVMDYVVSKILPTASPAKAPAKEMGMKELTQDLRQRLRAAVDRDLKAAAKPKKRRRR